MRANDCGECRQPLEEWEAGFCEGCGMNWSHDDKLKFVNSVIGICNAYSTIHCKLNPIFNDLLRMEVKDVTEQMAIGILNNLPARDTDDAENAVEIFMQRFFS